MLLDKLEKIGGRGLKGAKLRQKYVKLPPFPVLWDRSPPLKLMLIMLASPEIVMDFRLSVGN